ncbi:MAG: NAD-dependent epimerase/dehydratase family protein, partial [Actinomycetota bacterium]
VEHEVGDVMEPDSIARAIEGCDAVLHSAAMYSLDRRKARQIKTVNVQGTRNVIGEAVRRGLDPIIHVSSIAALLPPENGEILTPDSGIKNPPGAYLSSKADSERIARRYREEGKPVVIVNPGGILGPHDPHGGENVAIIRQILATRVAALPSGGLNIVDVRDLGTLFARLTESGKGPRGFVAGRYMTTKEMVETAGRLTGRSLKYRRIPRGVATTVGRLGDLLQWLSPWRIIANYEGVYTITLGAACDDSATWKPLGLTTRSTDETVADAIRWMVDAGHLKPKHAGTLAD